MSLSSLNTHRGGFMARWVHCFYEQRISGRSRSMNRSNLSTVSWKVSLKSEPENPLLSSFHILLSGQNVLVAVALI